MGHPIDVLRMGSAFERPGIDPRVWFCVGAIVGIRIDADGKYADVELFPSQRRETVLIGAGGAQGGGLHLPFTVGDVVVIGFPHGNAEEGGVILGGLWDPGQPPPAIVVSNPDDPAWVARTGRTLRIIGQAAGNVVLEVGDGQVRLGAESATRGCARLADTVQVTIPMGTVIIANPLFPGPGQPEFIPNPLPITLEGVITGASGTVKVR